MGRKPRSDTEFNEIIKEYGKPVETEEELIELAELINMEREFDNLVHQTNKPLLDIDYIKHRYKLISKRTATKTFMQQHDCRNCLYYQNPKKCTANGNCLLENEFEVADEIVKKKEPATCYRNNFQVCPYANDTGTCFGFCLKELLVQGRS